MFHQPHPVANQDINPRPARQKQPLIRGCQAGRGDGAGGTGSHEGPGPQHDATVTPTCQDQTLVMMGAMGLPQRRPPKGAAHQGRGGVNNEGGEGQPGDPEWEEPQRAALQSQGRRQQGMGEMVGKELQRSLSRTVATTIKNIIIKSITGGRR